MTTVDVAIRQQGPWLYGIAPLRLGLVLALFAYQSLEVSASYGRLINSPIWILPAALLPALFAIAGFLLSRSLDRSDLRGFIRRRLLRGWPVLACSVLVTALVIGPLATTASLPDYFSDRLLPLYLLNLIAIPVDRLPQLFTTNYVATVNDVLWAPPFAIAGVVILAAASRRERRTTAIVATALGALAVTALAVQFIAVDVLADLPVVRAIVAGKGLTALTCFLLGALAWQQRRRLVINRFAATAAALVIGAVAVLGARDWSNLAAFNTLIALPLTYLVVVLALARLPFAAAAATIYKYLPGFVLFAYPVQQLVISSRLVGDSFFADFAVSLPVTALLAGLAWHLVQRRCFDLSGGALTGADVAAARSHPVSVAAIWQRGSELAPEFALWIAFFIVAVATMAMTMFAYSPGSAGI